MIVDANRPISMKSSDDNRSDSQQIKYSELLVQSVADLNEQKEALQSEILTIQSKKKKHVEALLLMLHDLRAPLNAALTGAELHRLSNTEGPQEFAHLTSRSIKQALAMIDDFMEMEHPRNGHKTKCPLDTYDLVEQSKEILQDLRFQHDGFFNFNAPRSLKVCWSRGQIQRAILNLCLNAIAHSIPGTPICLTLLDDDEDVILSVHNFGAVITPDRQVKMFDPIASDNVKSIGKGLGLVSVAEIVRKHQGTVQVSSYPGRGTTFMLIIPKNPTAID